MWKMRRRLNWEPLHTTKPDWRRTGDRVEILPQKKKKNEVAKLNVVRSSSGHSKLNGDRVCLAGVETPQQRA